MPCKYSIFLPVNALKRIQDVLPVGRSHQAAYRTHKMNPAALVFGTWEFALYRVREADKAIRDEEQYLLQPAFLQTFEHLRVVQRRLRRQNGIVENFLVPIRRNAEQDVDSLLDHAVAAEINIHCVTKDDGISLGNRSAVKLLNLFRDICCNLGDGCRRAVMTIHLLDKLCDLTRCDTALVQLDDGVFQRIDTLFSRRQ